MDTHQQTVHEQFDPQAAAYLSSAVHAQGPDLLEAQRLVAAAIPQTGTALDVGCGAGHLSFALAPILSRVVALDASAGMLETVRTAALARGIKTIETQLANAESLPFANATFCVVASRYSAHHWTHLERALAEMRRVVRPGGHLLLGDTEAPEDALADTHLQAMELLRDRSHVRNRSPGEWQALLSASGWELLEHAHWPLRLDFASWVARMRTPAQNVAMIRQMQHDAPREVREALAIEQDGSFTVQTGLWWARAASPVSPNSAGTAPHSDLSSA